MKIVKEIDGHVVFFKRVNSNSMSSWVCAYAYFPNGHGVNPDNINFCTFEEENCLGVDTAHSWNYGMSLEERYDDAERQIREVIEQVKKIKERFD